MIYLVMEKNMILIIPVYAYEINIRQLYLLKYYIQGNFCPCFIFTSFTPIGMQCMNLDQD